MRKQASLLCSFFCFITLSVQAQFGSFASAVQLSTDGGTNKIFYNNQKLTGDANAIGPNNYSGSLGSFAAGEGRLKITGAEVKTFKGNNNNVCGVRLQYRVYLTGTSGGAFNNIQLPFLAGCVANVFADGQGPCSGNDQKWQSITANIDLTTQAVPGTYVLELYYDIAGSNTTTSGCSDTAYDSNLGNNYTATFDITPALPLQLMHFSGTKTAAGNLLQWTSAQEENFSHFEVQRSANGVTFTAVAIVAGKGNTVQQQQYVFTDSNPLGKMQLYRLKMIDKDGSFSYSKVIQVAANETTGTAIKLLANPVQHVLTITQLQPNRQLIIFDASGRIMHQQKTNVTHLTIPVAHWKSGMYFIKVVGENGREHMPFIKE